MNDVCTRFEDEALERLERGERLAAHFSACADCVEARRQYEQLQQEIGHSGAGLLPPEDWRQQVWARIESRSGANSLSRKHLLALAAVFTGAVLALLLLRPVFDDPGPLTLEAGIERQTTAVRGLDARPGDRLTLRAELGGRRHAELRVYREEEELILRCSTGPPCSRRGDLLEATVTLPAVGRYQTLLVASDAPLPEASGGFDPDAGAVLRAGGEVVAAEEIDVR